MNHYETATFQPFFLLFRALWSRNSVTNFSSSRASKWAMTLFHHCFQSFSCFRIRQGGQIELPKLSMSTKSVSSVAGVSVPVPGAVSGFSHLVQVRSGKVRVSCSALQGISGVAVLGTLAVPSRPIGWPSVNVAHPQRALIQDNKENKRSRKQRGRITYSGKCT